MSVVLMPLPTRDFDPTEAGVPWRSVQISQRVRSRCGAIRLNTLSGVSPFATATTCLHVAPGDAHRFALEHANLLDNVT